MTRFSHATLVLLGPLMALAGPTTGWVPCDPSVLTAQMARFDALMVKQARCKLTTEVFSYRRSADAVPSDQVFSTIWKDGKRFKAEQLGLYSYQNDSLCAAVDEDERTVVISEPRSAANNALNDRIKGLMHGSRTVAYLDTEGSRVFRVEYDRESPNAYMDITYQPDGWMSEVVLQLRSGNYAGGEGAVPNIDDPKVVFRFQRPVPLDGKGAVSIGQGPLPFIRAGAEGLTLTGKWSSYRLIDTRYRP